MAKRKTSKIWLMPLDEFKSLISKSKTYRDILKNGFKVCYTNGGNFRTLKQRIKEEKISTSHFKTQEQWRKKIPLSQICIKGSTYARGSLKKRLLKIGIIRNICYKCNVLPVWKDKPLTLILDHINGVSSDNRIENLQMLCPNCNSQTVTFAGRNIKRKKREIYKCICGNIILKQSKLCVTCDYKRREKIKWPSVDELITMVAESNYCAVGRKLGVSDTAIRKRIQKYK